MFTLGNKEAIVNSTQKFKITNAAVSTWAANVDTLSIKGFADFHKDQIVAGFGQRYVAGEGGALRIETPTAAELGIVSPETNVAVIAHIRVKATNDSSEWANDFITRGRPFIFEISVSHGDTAAIVATKLNAAFAKYETAFNLSSGLPFTYGITTISGGPDQVTLVAKSPELGFGLSVSFLRRQESFGVNAVTDQFVSTGVTGATALAAAVTVPTNDSTKFKVGDTIGMYDVSADAYMADTAVVTAIPSGTTLTVATGFVLALEATDVVFVETPPSEDVNSGKYLEENVKMGNFENATPYALNNGEVPDVGGAYSSISWTAKATDNDGVAKTWQPHANLAIVAAGAETGTRNQDFTLYFKEDTSLLASGGVVEVLVNWLIDTAGITNANFKLASGASAADGAGFVA